MNPPGIFQGGQRLRTITIKDSLPFSGKLMPEFDRRRSIKDMFRRGNSTQSTPPSTLGAVSQVPGSLSIVEREASASQVPGAAITALGKKHRLESAAPSLNIAVNARTQEDPPVKKLKASSQNIKQASSNQKSLKSFFKSKQSETSNINQNVDCEPPAGSSIKDRSIPRSTPPAPASPSSTTGKQGSEPSPSARFPESSAGSANSPEKFIDPFVSKTEWTKLFHKRDPPRCEHGEPCISLETKKKGPNCGRFFWICPR